MNAVIAAEIDRMKPAEKLQLVEELWDQLAAVEDRLPIPSWHETILAEDQAKYNANPTEGSTWTEAKGRITGQS
jgi:putative addiction module component (TIGR02574 family)